MSREPRGRLSPLQWLHSRESDTALDAMQHGHDLTPLLCQQRHSQLWPPPSPALTQHVQDEIKRRVRNEPSSALYPPDIETTSSYTDNQIQPYAQDAQLNHPYVSPVFGNLAGLPPCFFIAGDAEMLRDETIYG